MGNTIGVIRDLDAMIQESKSPKEESMFAVTRRRASVALNAALFAFIAGLIWHRATATPRPAGSIGSVPPPAQTSENVTNPRHVATTLASLSRAERRRSIIDELRKKGVPGEMLALVARVDFEMQWDDRFKSCRGDPEKLAAVQLEMNMSKDAALQAALGEATFKQWDQKCMLWEAMSTKVEVSHDEAEAIYALKKKLQQAQYTVEQARLKGAMDEATINEAYDRSYSEYFSQLKTILGDERYAKSQQLDKEFVLGNLRHELSKINPSEAQVQQLFNIEQGWKQAVAELDHQFQNDPTAIDYRARTKALAEAREIECQRVLGSEAYDNLRKQQDPTYAEMKKYQQLWGLDDTKVDNVYSALRQYKTATLEYESQLKALAAQGQPVDGAKANAYLHDLANHTQVALQEYLGPASYNRLLRNRVLPFNQPRSLSSAPLR